MFGSSEILIKFKLIYSEHLNIISKPISSKYLHDIENKKYFCMHLKN